MFSGAHNGVQKEYMIMHVMPKISTVYATGFNYIASMQAAGVKEIKELFEMMTKYNYLKNFLQYTKKV